MTDAIVVTVGVVAVLLAGSFLETVPGSGRVEVALIWALLLLYEPLLVWRRGATIGHRRLHLSVVTNSGRPPGFVRALTRFLIKGVLGLFSFIPMFLTRRHQALHDILTGTRVLITDPATAASYHMSVERPADWLDATPSALRRLTVILLFVALLLVAWIALLARGVSRQCLAQQQCTGGEDMLLSGSTWTWLASTFVVVVIGWRGQLPGARRKQSLAADTRVT